MPEADRLYRNHYSCVCGEQWEDEWDCTCDDRCPKCDTSISPHMSEDLTTEPPTIIDHA